MKDVEILADTTVQTTDTLSKLSVAGPATVIDAVAAEVLRTTDQSAFFTIDLGELHRRYRRWCKLLPTVTPFYAIKCNTDPMLLQVLNNLGANFDCASKEEIRIILDMGVTPDRIIFANPCKQISHIKYAAQVGVKRMTFDNADELYKVKDYHPDAELVLRILADDSKSVCQFGAKFGASLSVTESLLSTAKDLGLNVMGVSFHVGSGCFDAAVYADAVQRARIVFDQAEAMGFAPFTLLDLGGGYPGLDGVDGCPMDEIASELRPALHKLFPGVEVIAEPGRYFAAAAYVLAVNVHSRRVVMNGDQKSFMYYINDGVYGSFNCLIFDHAKVTPLVLMKGGELMLNRHAGEDRPCSIWGPTCDSMDCITRTGMLPELNVGDWLMFENMGAYTVSASTTFNGMPRPRMLYVDTDAV